ncbi:MAG: pyruvate kinase [Hyphomicrobiaceae bacterium]|nr:pyruvate kinase [Hyphomicrobiaceae bacterium]MCC0024116.1 pyruvate kinase [Hyphomicrobiaceae bacterium]
MKFPRRVKILATLGPASNSDDMVRRLVEAGANVFRINMSHASHDLMRETVARIRRVEEQLGRPLGILVDLQGPKIRVGTFANGAAELMDGQTFALDRDPALGDVTRVYLPHPEIFEAIEAGHRLLLDDGKIALKVTGVTGDRITTEVLHGGVLSNKKGVSVPDTLLNLSAMTEKDHADLEEALDEQIDWVALSFVQRPEDVMDVRKVVRGRAGVMAKIEKPQAIDRLEDIFKLCDAVMIARGDLGVEMPLEQVPGLQKRMIRMARRFGKPVVVATQMLESMIHAPVPTRAEVSDVSIAVFEGADAIMLSAESAAGDFPIEAVETMNKVAQAVEQDINYQSIIRAQQHNPEATAADAIAAATRQVAETLDLAAIVTYTSSGSTGLRAARERPATPIMVLSPELRTVRRLSLVWGLYCYVMPDPEDVEDMVARACAISADAGFAEQGERIAITAGVPFGTPGTTNMLRIAYVGGQ